jgi:hypothetical protein
MWYFSEKVKEVGKLNPLNAKLTPNLPFASIIQSSPYSLR